MSNQKITQEELLRAKQEMTTDDLLEADAYFNLASMLGKSIQAAAFQAQNPEYNPEAITWNPASESSASDERDKAEDAAFTSAAVQPEPGISSNEGSIDIQIDQLIALHCPPILELLRPSALYGMFQLAEEQFNFELASDDPEQELSPNDKRKAAIAWIIAKRVFAVRHPDETLRVLSLTDIIRGTIVHGTKPPAFRSIDQTDREMVIDTCSLFLDDLETNNGIESTFDRMNESITQLISSGKIFLPSAEAFRRQNDLALAASDRKLSVGGGANITAKITAPDGKSPLELSMFEMHIEAAVGQLFQENGFKPITVTPEQIYRAFAGLSSGVTVSDKQREETIKAMDKLIITPATLDFTEQIEKHTRMKKREGFDYNDSQRRGTLITGVHDRKSSKTYNGKSITDTFTIHELPMFYAYSYAMGQLYTVQAKYLSGEAQADPDAAKKTKPVKVDIGPQRSSIDDTVLFRVLLEYIEFQKSEKEKRDRKYLREKKPAPVNFEFYLPFDTVAEKASIKNPSAKTMRNLRDKTYNFMMAQAKMGNIKKSDYYKKGRLLYGVKVTI